MDNNFQELEENLNCTYYSIDEFNELIKDKKEIFSILSQNIRSMRKNFSEFKDLLSDISGQNFNFSVYMLQEIWGVGNLKFSLEGYHDLIFKERETQRGGGVGIFLKNNFEYEIIEEISIFDEGIFESLFLKVYIDKNRYKIIGNIYKPPNSSIENFNDKLTSILDIIRTNNLYRNSEEIIFAGDFNVNILRYLDHNLTNQFLSMFLSNSFLPCISLPTRFSHNNATLIDNIFTNRKSTHFESGLIIHDISDHLPIFLLSTKKVNKQDCKNTIPMVRNFSKINIETFKSNLAKEDWNIVSNKSDPELAFNEFSQIIDRNFEKSFPYSQIKKNIRCKPKKNWMTQEILELRKKKDKCYKNRLKDPSERNINCLKEINSLYQKKIRDAKKSFYNAKFTEFSNDMKKTWTLINSIISRKKHRESLPKIFFDEIKSYENSQDIANGFNDFFINIGEKLAANIPHSNKHFSDYLGNRTEKEFLFPIITNELILKTLSKLKSKKSAGEDNISMYLLKEIANIIINPLTYLFNLSFQHGYLPPSYKCAKVVPVFKTGNKSRFDNYRPISLLSNFAKLLEKIVSIQMIRFIEENKILYKHQYGFRPGHDTTQPLINLLDRIYTNLNKPISEYTLNVFLDLKKAFDTVDIGILLTKLEFYGFRHSSLKWFKNYLSNRQQFVSIEGVNSCKKTIKFGVPQGSVIGPILFLLYINDLPNATNFFTNLFADDTSFAKSNKNLSELIRETNIELSKAQDWFRSNRLSLNVSKTKYIIFCNNNMQLDKNICKLNIGGEIIERIGNDCPTKSFKFVGLLIDDQLKWNFHINHVQNKVASSIYAISQTKKLLPQKILKTIYNSLTKPHIEYGLMVWGLARNELTQKIAILQKRAFRNIVNAKYNAHTDPIACNLELLNIYDLLESNIAEFVAKFLQNKLPDSINNLFSPLNNMRTKNLRLEKPKYKTYNSFPTVAFPKIWNSLPIEVKSLDSPSAVKKCMKRKFLNNYRNFNCQKRKCYPCKKN